MLLNEDKCSRNLYYDCGNLCMLRAQWQWQSSSTMLPVRELRLYNYLDCQRFRTTSFAEELPSFPFCNLNDCTYLKKKCVLLTMYLEEGTGSPGPGITVALTCHVGARAEHSSSARATSVLHH